MNVTPAVRPGELISSRPFQRLIDQISRKAAKGKLHWARVPLVAFWPTTLIKQASIHESHTYQEWKGSS